MLVFDAPAVVRFEKANQELVDRVLRDVWKLHEKPVAQALVRAVADMLDDVTLTKLLAALQTGDVNKVLAAIPWNNLGPSLAEEFTHLRASYEIGGSKAAHEFGSTFSVTTPDVMRWVLANGDTLPRYLEAHKADALRQALRHASLRGYSNRRLAGLLLKGDLVALDPRSVNAVFNYLRRQLEAGVPVATADARAIAYSNRLLRTRALMIARTELSRTAVEGTIQAWRQMQSEGMVSREAYLEWRTRPEGDWPCDPCDDMHGRTTPLGSTFGGLMPPLHPNCRCIPVLIDPRGRRRR